MSIYGLATHGSVNQSQGYKTTKANGAQSALWAEINRQMTKIRVWRILRAVRLSDSTNERQEIISLIGWYFCWCWREQWLSLMLVHETRLCKVQLVSAICGIIRVSLQMTTDFRDMFLTMGVATGGSGGYLDPPLLKSGGDVPTRFENEVAQGHI